MQAAARAARIPVAIPATIAAAWVISAFAQFSGSAAFLRHDALIERGPPLGFALALFVLAWLVMIAAMMLPSSWTLLRMFAAACAGQPRSNLVFASFLGGYAVVWCMFGIAAFLGDVLVHRTADRVAWIGGHPWIIAGGVLALAGAFQFTPLKDACLRACRLPATFLLRYYKRGTRAAFGVGYRHGLFCAGCCWALMLISFAAGFASLWWMAALTALMVYEKIAVRGRSAVSIAGVILLVWSALIFAHPGWLPPALSGV